MIRAGTNSTYFGFITFHLKDGKQKGWKVNSYCSQSIWEYPKLWENIKTIKFFFPTDWCLNIAVHKKFLEEYCELANSIFKTKLKYIGTFPCSVFGATIENINKGNGNNPNASFLSSKGDLIVNDSWEGFELDVSENKETKDYRSYCSYCFVRYLFCDGYHTLVKRFLILRRNSTYYTGSSCIDEFSLFILAHYITKNNEYSQSFGFCFNIGNSAYIKKIPKHDVFLKNLSSNVGLNNASSGQNSDLKRYELDKLVEENKIKEVYERLTKA